MAEELNITSLKDFRMFAKRGNLVPIRARIAADMDTPVSAFLRMTEGPHRFLLESLENPEKWGRYSFLGSEPLLRLRSRKNQIEIFRGNKMETHFGNPLEMVREILSNYKIAPVRDMPRFFGGFIGYFGYDMVQQMEKIPDYGKSETAFYDCQLMLQDEIICFDNLLHEVEVIVLVNLENSKALKKAYDRGIERVHQIVRRLKKPIPHFVHPKKKAPFRLKPNTSKEEFLQIVNRCKEYIRAGDIFQVVPSQRWEIETAVHPFEAYRHLRQINPSPYLFYLEMDGQVILGSSPEVMVSLENDEVSVRPIAGTRRRGRSEEDEIKMEQEILTDPKEIAEHIMLVDLGRNDIGRVAQIGSVEVDEMMIVEKYSHVMHIVSNVKGKLKPGKDAIDVLNATFPAGTLSGAPKIRAMEIISELEKEKRGPYGGCVGFLGYSGNLNTAIMIRSIFFNQGKAWLQAGAGVVLDSDPELEYLECQNKAKALVETLKRCYS